MPKMHSKLRSAPALRCLSFVCSLALSTAASAAGLSHGTDTLFHDGFNPPSAGPYNDPDASRFLTQATFGPTDADIAHLRAVGYQGWLNEQFAAAPTYEMNYLNWTRGTLNENVGQSNRQEAWFLGALGGPDPQNNALIHTDQLRQRVAFALSEILVTSDQNNTLSGFPLGLAYYYDILARDAFGNYRTLLEEVTLSPAMGVYLNMMGNRRADLSQNQHPDENYGREINQLFSVGLVMLNDDGTPKLDGAGKTIPTYDQSTITSFAHVFTGWNWADCDANGYDNFVYCGPDYDASANFLTPMVPYETPPPRDSGAPSYHDNGTDLANDQPAKRLLVYPNVTHAGLVFVGKSAAQDLAFALDNIFNHPNVGPFISKQLIQRLVTSNPSPAYVQRVATVFNNNGANVRGDLKAVVTAILLDDEARNGQQKNPATYGKLREPLLTLTHFWRAMHAQHKCGLNVDQDNGDGTFTHFRYANQPYRYGGYFAWNTSATQYGGVDQASLDAFTVFNFFKPGFKPSGELSALNLVAPEFQLQTDSIIANSTNTYTQLYYYGNNDTAETCASDDDFGDVKIDHAQDVALAGSGQGGAADPADRLVDAYNKRFMSGQMSPYMRNQLLTDLNPIDQTWANNGEDWRVERINRALFLILTSPEYMIQK